MKRFLILLLSGLAFLNLPACGDENSRGDLFKEEGPLPQAEPGPPRTPQAEFKPFTNNPNLPPRLPSESAPAGESALDGEFPATDDAEEDSPRRQEDEATQPPEPSQPRHKRDTAPKSQSRRNENLDDIPPEDESGEVQDSPPDENSGGEEAPPEENGHDQESPETRPEF